ncbi:CLM8 protein, partial [Rhadina sibilatrix]|nr:CLM8 protein [Rhadina sibilatrix]
AKYWCLQTAGRQCQEQMYTLAGREAQYRDGRITIKDDRLRRTVSVTMTHLKAEDSGTYFCA